MSSISLGYQRSFVADENETRCYDELGCLNITRSWYHLINRPFNMFPLPRNVINTRFILYTRLNPLEGQIIKANNQSIEKSNLDIKKKMKFIIHGFIDTPLSNWVGDMRDELLRAQDMNVIIVDWAGGSLPLYTQATANTRLVGMEIANLINYLVAFNLLMQYRVAPAIHRICIASHEHRVSNRRGITAECYVLACIGDRLILSCARSLRLRAHIKNRIIQIQNEEIVTAPKVYKYSQSRRIIVEEHIQIPQGSDIVILKLDKIEIVKV
ncbi:hypothetical protein NQ318_011582 [Aromia moschata]|uniref:Lipase domain-containing protein n=1 Tax=Aromia moschata TaxID=1265417 RepID=A0AAV8Z8K9_9CUCU|nr:hypothetical protein NQ318_011582 [Aromia moschata]